VEGALDQAWVPTSSIGVLIMTHWAEKIVSNTEWALVQEAVEKQFKALGSPRDMMLVAVEGQADATRLVIGFDLL
jgi:hypothetical protein